VTHSIDRDSRGLFTRELKRTNKIEWNNFFRLSADGEKTLGHGDFIDFAPSSGAYHPENPGDVKEDFGKVELLSFL
jgi:hypothetical protein